MQPTQFTDAVYAVAQREQRFDVGAYFFLKDALDFTVKRVMDNNNGEHRHVSASVSYSSASAISHNKNLAQWQAP